MPIFIGESVMYFYVACVTCFVCFLWVWVDGVSVWMCKLQSFFVVVGILFDFVESHSQLLFRLSCQIKMPQKKNKAKKRERARERERMALEVYNPILN